MSRLAVHLLGPPRVECNGVPIQVDTRKAIALLAYLAVTGERHRRASLANLLWPEYDRTRGRAALRRTLYALRKALDGPWLEVDQEEIGLVSVAGTLTGSELALWVDVDQFRHLLATCETHGHPPSGVCPACVASLTEAVALVRGDFLAGFSLRDSFHFDDWQFFQADALRRELASALERLVRWHSAQHKFESAAAHARRWLALDPLNEAAHCELMKLYTWSGQRPAALRQYKECVRILDDQLGVPPQGSTTRLCREIEAGGVPPLPMPQPWTDPAARSPRFLEGEVRAERPIFVAREQELAALGRHLEAALAGQAGVVLVTGEAGSGKTALIREFALRAQAAFPDLIIAWGHGNAHTGVGDPYLPFREILSLLTGDVEAQGVAGAMTGEQARRLWHLLPQAVQALVAVGPDLVDRFLPGAALARRAAAVAPLGCDWLAQLQGLVAGREVSPGNPDLQQITLFEQYTQVLGAIASQRPLLLALDDLQWVDGGSVNLLFHLGRRMAGSRILIVGAYRPAEVALGRQASSPLTGALDFAGDRDGTWQRHPLVAIVNEFKRTFGDIEVDLECATAQEARGRRFVDALLDIEPNRLGERFRATLYQHTRGNPLFTIELLRGMQERGGLVHDGAGQWIEGPALDWETLPARIEAVIAERVNRLPPHLERLLTIASVEGETFTAEVVAQVGEVDRAETVHALSDILDRRCRLVSAQGIVRSDGQCLSRYRFRHILFQKYLCSRLDPVERAHLHQAVGAVLEALHREGMQRFVTTEAGAAQLARHFEAAGIVEKAVEYLCQAGDRARGLYANAEAMGYFRRALQLLEYAPPAKARRHWQLDMAASLHERLGDVLEWIGEHENAAVAYQAALGYIPTGDQIRQSKLDRKLGNVWRLQSQHQKALRAYRRAAAALGPETTESSSPEWWHEWVQIQLERMWLYYWLGQWREMSELAKIRPSVERHGNPSQCVSFFLCLASMNNRRDRYVVVEETLDFCRIALAIAQESEDVGEIAWARFVLGFSQLWYGDLDASEKQMRAALTLAEETGDIVHQSRCLTYLAVLFRKLGQLDQARQYASDGLDAARAGQMVEYVGTAQANLAWVAWREGDLAQAEAHGQAALESCRQLPPGHASCAFQWTALWPLTAVAAARNQVPEACAWLHTLLEPSQQPLPCALAAAVKDTLRAGHGDDPDEARRCLGRAIDLAREMGYL